MTAQSDHDLVKKLHETLGHHGFQRLKKWCLQNAVCIPHLDSVLRDIKSRCALCLELGKQRTEKVVGDRIGPEGLTSVSCDIGELKRTRRGNKYFLVVNRNRGENVGGMFPLSNMTAGKIAECLARILVCYPQIKAIRMDNAPHFKNKVVLELLENEGLIIQWSILYKPHTNGVAERAVCTVKEAIKTLNLKEWDSPGAVLAINKALLEQPLRQETAKDTLSVSPQGEQERSFLHKRPQDGKIEKIEGSQEGNTTRCATPNQRTVWLGDCKKMGPTK
nr:uncharacterized protein LOC129165124 [Nothobranchius furzeri]